jgi:hypothetical protein
VLGAVLVGEDGVAALLVGDEGTRSLVDKDGL